MYVYSANLFAISGGIACGQTAVNLSALLIPFHGEADTGGMKRRLPTGGDANGIPLKTRTFPESGTEISLPSTCPWRVVTTDEEAVAVDKSTDRMRTSMISRLS